LLGVELIEALLVIFELIELGDGVGEPPEQLREQIRIAVRTPRMVRTARLDVPDVVHLVFVLLGIAE
jgi:hypothetical protein